MLTPSRRLVGLLCALGAPLCWSVGGVVMRSVDTGPWEIVFWRSFGHVLAFPVLLAVVFGVRSLRDFGEAGWRIPVVVLCVTCSLVLHVLAITHTAVANVLIVQSISPFLVTVLAHLLLGERPGARGWAFTAVAFLGLAPVLGGSLAGGHGSGDLFALGVAVGSAITVIIVRAGRRVNLLPATAVSAVLSMAVAWPFGAPSGVGAGDAVLLMLLGMVQSTIGLTLFFTALRLLPAGEVVLISLLEPALGPLWVWLAIGEQPAVATLIGGAVVLAALAANTALAARAPAPAAAP